MFFNFSYPDCVKLCEHQNGRLPEEEFENLASWVYIKGNFRLFDKKWLLAGVTVKFDSNTVLEHWNVLTKLLLILRGKTRSFYQNFNPWWAKFLQHEFLKKILKGFDVSNFHLPSNRSKFDCSNFGFYVGAHFNFTSKTWNFKNSKNEIRKGWYSRYIAEIVG